MNAEDWYWVFEINRTSLNVLFDSLYINYVTLNSLHFHICTVHVAESLHVPFCGTRGNKLGEFFLEAIKTQKREWSKYRQG